MKQQDSLTITGRWRLTARNRFTGEVIVKEGKNLVVIVGKQLVGDLLIDRDGYDTGFTYMAIGTGDTTPTTFDTTLTAEAARKTITSRTRSGNVITLSTFFTNAECTYNIKEGAVFGHSTASATPDSGIMGSHWLVSFDNSGGVYDLTFDLMWTIG